MNKIAAFLDPLREVSSADRGAMVRRLEEDPVYNRRVAVHLLELLDRLDSHRKPVMIAFCFLEFLRGAVNTLQLLRLFAAIEALPAAEIDSVRRFVDSRNNPTERAAMDPESIQALSNAGLAEWAQAAPIGGKVLYRETQTALLFVEFALDRRSRPRR